MKRIVVVLVIMLVAGSFGFLPIARGVEASSVTPPPGWTSAPSGHLMMGFPIGVPVLVLQDAYPWGSSSHISVLLANGYAPTIATWSDLGVTIDLDDFANVYVASDQPTAFYNAYAVHASELTDWVTAGGHLVFSACDQGWNGGSLSTALPGGAVKTNGSAYQNYVVDPAHPIVSGVLSDGIPLASPFSGTSASHVYFSVLPENEHTIIRDSSFHPTLVEYALGSGLVVASGLTWEFAQDNNQGSKPAFDDLFLYAFPKSMHTISASAGVGGTIEPAGEIHVVEGASKSFTITPSRRYVIAAVSVDGVSVGSVGTYTFTNVTSDHTIHASFRPLDSAAPVIELPDGVPQGGVGSPFSLHLLVTDDRSVADVGIYENGTRIGGSSTGGDIRIPLSLGDGRHDLVIVAADDAGRRTEKAVTLTVDTRGPVLTLDLPASVTTKTLSIAGSAVDAVSGLKSLTIDGTPVIPFLDGSFQEKLTLTKGVNTIVVEAVDNVGNTTSQTFTVTYASPSSSAPSSIYVVLTIGSGEMSVNGMARPLDAAPVIKNGRTLLPIRALIETLGGSADWNAATKTATVALGSRTVVLTIGSTTALVNGAPVKLDVAPVIVGSRTFLPLRAVAENLGLDLAWEPVSRTISFTYWP